jgi:hypothetical protein
VINFCLKLPSPVVKSMIHGTRRCAEFTIKFWMHLVTGKPSCTVLFVSWTTIARCRTSWASSLSAWFCSYEGFSTPLLAYFILFHCRLITKLTNMFAIGTRTKWKNVSCPPIIW